MPEYLAIDCSGSTISRRNKKIYWPRVIKYIQTIKSENITYLFWNSRLERETNNRNKALEICSLYERDASCCTDPSVFVDKLKKDEEGIKLTIFTDGEIHQENIDKCDIKLKNKGIIIQDLTIYYCGAHEMNLSVSTPFTTKDCAPKGRGMRFSAYINDEPLMQENVTIKAEPIVDQLKACKDNIELFITLAPELLAQLKIDKLTLRDPKSKVIIKEEVVKLQKNLMQTMARDASENIGEEILKLVNSLKDKHEEDPLKQLQELLGKLTKKSSEKKINEIKEYFEKMILAINNSENFNFMQLEDKNKRSEPIEMKNIRDLEEDEINSNIIPYICPITCDDDIATLPIRDGSPILEGLDKVYTRLIMSNPFIILSNPILVGMISQRLDRPIGAKTLKRINILNREGNKISSPITRQDCSSYISTGTEYNHLGVTNYAIADIFSPERNNFGIKLAGVRALYLAVIYFVANEITSHLKPDSDNNDEDKLAFMNAFKANLLYRLNMDQTNLCLSGSPADGPLVQVPLAIAIWYCVQTLKLKNVPTRIDILTKYHLKLLDLLKYPYDKEWTRGRIALHQVFKVMMREEKSQPASHLRNWLRCLYQNSIRLTDGTIIFIDGESTLYQDLASFRVVVNLFDETTLTKDTAYLYQLPLLDSNNKQTTLKLIDTRKLDKESDEYLYSLPILTLLGLEKLLDKGKTVANVKIPDQYELNQKIIPEPKKTYINKGENTNPSSSLTELLNEELNKLIKNIESRGQTSDLNDEEKRGFREKIKNIESIKEYIQKIIDNNNNNNNNSSIDQKIDKEIDKRMGNNNGFIDLNQESSKNVFNINKLTSWDIFIESIMQVPKIKKEFESHIVSEKNRSELIQYIKDLKHNRNFIKYLLAPQKVVKFKKGLELRFGTPLFLQDPVIQKEFGTTRIVCEENSSELIQCIKDSKHNRKFIKYLASSQVAPQTVTKFIKDKGLELKFGTPLFLEKFKEFLLKTSPLIIKYLTIDAGISYKMLRYCQELNIDPKAQVTPNKTKLKINDSKMPSAEDLIKSLLDNHKKDTKDVFPKDILELANKVISERSKKVENVNESSEEVITQELQVAASSFFSHEKNNKSGSDESRSCQSVVMQPQR
jgi:hypothetical protein